jgi:hypothetical protein
MICRACTSITKSFSRTFFICVGSNADFFRLWYWQCFGSGFIESGLGIWIQHFRLNTDLDLDLIRMQGFDGQKLEKNLQLTKI